MLFKELNNKKLSNLNPKDEFKIGDQDFIVLEQDGCITRVISKEPIYRRNFGNNSNWYRSSIRKELNDEYFNKIANVIRAENILYIDRDLTPLGGGFNNYGLCTDRISLLTMVEYVKYHKILESKISQPDLWYLITPFDAQNDGSSRKVCCVYFDRAVFWVDCDCVSGVRPILNIRSSIFI